MKFANVIGTVVLTKTHDRLPEGSMRLVQPTDTSGKKKGIAIVAYDLLGSSPGEKVIIAQGSSCRQGPQLNTSPVDAIIAGIVDTIEQEGKILYQKKEV
ncbi:MAG: ethanolamine utilization protein EutN [Candidatus Hydrogenedentota bacterium]|nr:MAG: ethanolamine utilization protein EutN [Candidatus Hydrogenedentota bacterium]